MGTATDLAKKTPLYAAFNFLRQGIRGRRIIRRWRSEGCPIPPPPQVKHRTIAEYAKRFQLDVLVETGTFYGDTLAATKRHFAELYSIELSPGLHSQAVKRFTGESSVHLLLGDSGKILREILPRMTRTPLFWLDAHFSGGQTARGSLDTPVVEELEAILASCPNSVVLIDDARLFDGTNSYPTIGALRRQLMTWAPHWVLEVKDDIIRLHARMD